MTRRSLVVIAALGTLLGLLVIRPAGAEPLHEQRAFTVHIPDPLPAEPVPLVLALHGCSQDGGTFPVGTRLPEVADAEGFVVVFPEQDRAANASACWNWFLPEHQQRGAGEPAILAAIVEHVASQTVEVERPGRRVGHDKHEKPNAERRPLVDRDRIYVTGLSAGADMATVMAVTYPDVFRAVAPVAGCAYLTCADVTGEAALAAMGPYARPVPAMVVQSTGDEVNNVAMGETAVQQWQRVYALAGGSPTDEPEIHHTPASGGGGDDLCIRASQYPCPAGALGWSSYPVTTRTWTDTVTGCLATQAWTIHGAGHAWTGGDPAGKYTEPAGPMLSEEIWRFFEAVTDCG